MPPSPTLSPADIEWNDLLDSLLQRKCVLLLGPQLLPDTRVFDALCRWLDDPANPAGLRRGDLSVRYPNDELFLFSGLDARTRVSGKIGAFYQEFSAGLADAYAKIAELPFPLIVSTLPDEGLHRWLEQAGIAHQSSFYHRRGTPKPHERIADKPIEQRALFNLFGKIGERESLVLTHEDLFDYLRSILGAKPLTDDFYLPVSEALTDADDFIFLGFQFDKWYMQLLLRLLNPELSKGRQYAFNPELADETLVFFADQFKVDFVSGMAPLEFLSELHLRWRAHEQRFETGAPLRQNLLDWLKQGQLQRILDKLDAHFAAQNDKHFHDQVILLSAGFTGLRQNIRNGTVLSEHASVEMNRIRAALLDIIRHMN
ncbi:MAG: SIR2 family protein [Saprospiraceae bacterium]|nr:SIR2 family protein [Saprospiraceae bacterium]